MLLCSKVNKQEVDYIDQPCNYVKVSKDSIWLESLLIVPQRPRIKSDINYKFA